MVSYTRVQHAFDRFCRIGLGLGFDLGLMATDSRKLGKVITRHPANAWASDNKKNALVDDLVTVMGENPSFVTLYSKACRLYSYAARRSVLEVLCYNAWLWRGFVLLKFYEQANRLISNHLENAASQCFHSVDTNQAAHDSFKHDIASVSQRLGFSFSGCGQTLYLPVHAIYRKISQMEDDYRLYLSYADLGTSIPETSFEKQFSRFSREEDLSANAMFHNEETGAFEFKRELHRPVFKPESQQFSQQKLSSFDVFDKTWRTYKTLLENASGQINRVSAYISTDEAKIENIFKYFKNSAVNFSSYGPVMRADKSVNYSIYDELRSDIEQSGKQILSQSRLYIKMLETEHRKKGQPVRYRFEKNTYDPIDWSCGAQHSMVRR